MKTGAINFMVALFMFGCAMYNLVVSNDICHIVMTSAIGLFNAIIGAMFVITEKIDSHENKTTRETEKRSE